MPEAIALANQVSAFGFPTLLVIILFASYKGVWVWGRQYEEMRVARDRWEAMALKSTNLLGKVVNNESPA